MARRDGAATKDGRGAVTAVLLVQRASTIIDVRVRRLTVAEEAKW